MYHPDYPKLIVVVPFHNTDIKKGLLKRILRDADMDIEELIKYL
jgi:predicted RNA binding protein YcfA (HicA-like mRNA interferase family)